jgi:hypothetical protein
MFGGHGKKTLIYKKGEAMRMGISIVENNAFSLPDGYSIPHENSSWWHAITLAANRAKEALPHAEVRVERARQLVLDGRIEIVHSSLAKVTSSRGTFYTSLINGDCTCVGSGSRNTWCHHLIATWLYCSCRLYLQVVQPSS